MNNFKIHSSKVLLFFVGTILVLALYNIIKIFWPEPTPEVVKDPNFGLELTEDPEDINFDSTQGNIGDLTGYLYFDSIARTSAEETDTIDKEDALSANLYRYNFEGEATVPIFEFGESYDGNPVSSTSIAFVATLSDGDGGTRSAHVLLDTTTGQYKELTNGDGDQAHELVVAPENPDRIAFVFHNHDAEDQYLVSSYGILVSDYARGTDVELLGAVSPAWNASGTALYFVREDGMYRYDLQTEETTLINNKYTNHSVFTHLSVAPDERFMVLTMPALNTISVMTLGLSDTGEYVASEIGVIQDVGVVYKTPVISPDSRYYAVVAARGSDEEKEHVIEVRHYLDRAVTTSIIPNETDSRYLNLSGWGEVMVEGMDMSEDLTATELSL